MTIATAGQNAVTLLIEEQGAKGLPGVDGTDGTGFNSVRRSLIDNPLCHLFKKNSLTETLAGALTWTRASGATYVDRYGSVKYSPSPSATNKVLQSQTIDNASWIKVRS